MLAGSRMRGVESPRIHWSSGHRRMLARWAGGSVELLLPDDAGPDLWALAGKTGVLAVALVDYAGFEPVQRVVSAAVVEGVPIEPSLAAQIARLPAVTDQHVERQRRPTLLDDALDEAVFVDQREAEKARAGAFRAGYRPARAIRRRQGTREPPRTRHHRREVALGARAARSGRRVDRQRSGGGGDCAAGVQGTRRWSAGSPRWSPGKTRSTENGGTNTTSFDTGRPK